MGYVDDVLVKHSATTPEAMRRGLASKTERLLKKFSDLHCPVFPGKAEYFVVPKGATVPSDALRVDGFPALRPK